MRARAGLRITFNPKRKDDETAAAVTVFSLANVIKVLMA
jgi:hypothetical protein